MPAKKIFTTALAILISAMVYAQDIEEIVQEITQAIELNETQSKALERQMGRYAISLQLIFDRYAAAEPDPQAMLSDIKRAREEYHKALKSDLGKKKFAEYEDFVEQVQLEILGEVAELRLLDLQDPLKMTDEQLLQMKPILAKAMRGIMATIMKYVDKPLNVRNKLKIANSIKSIQKTLDKETAKVLTTEQIKKWEEIKSKNQQ